MPSKPHVPISAPAICPLQQRASTAGPRATVVYVRVNRDVTGESAVRQRDCCLGYARRLVGGAPRVYSDLGSGRASLPAMRDLLEDAGAGLVDRVIVTDLERISRDCVRLVEVWLALRRHGVAIHVAAAGDPGAGGLVGRRTRAKRDDSRRAAKSRNVLGVALVERFTCFGGRCRK